MNPLRLILVALVVAAIGLLILMQMNRAKVEEVSKEEQETFDIWLTNGIKEYLMLLALKHEIHEEMLTRVVIDYERMTQGYSVVEEMVSMISSKKGEPEAFQGKLVDSATAVNDISQKYGIPKKILSSIIIERKLMGSAERRLSDDRMPLDQPPLEGWR